MDPATDRAIEALADAITEFVTALSQLAVALAAAFESVGLAFATIIANARVGDLDEQWRQVAPAWGARH